MWVACAFGSAFLIGLMEVFRKQALEGNNVLKVLLLNVLFCTLFLTPFLINGCFHLHWFTNPIWQIPDGTLTMHILVFLKASVVLAAWICTYFALKHLPLTLVAPINAVYPVLTLLGALILFGERLNLLQWFGIFISVYSLFLLNNSGKKEGISFAHNKWVWLLGASALFHTASGLYDKYLMHNLHFLFVQSWYNVYQLILMIILVGVLTRTQSRKKFHWSWAIVAASAVLTVSEFLYFYSLRDPEALISIVSMIRRSSVIVTFACGAILFHEKNVRAKAKDMVCILIGMILLYIGSTL